MVTLLAGLGLSSCTDLREPQAAPSPPPLATATPGPELPPGLSVAPQPSKRPPGHSPQQADIRTNVPGASITSPGVAGNPYGTGGRPFQPIPEKKEKEEKEKE